MVDRRHPTQVAQDRELAGYDPHEVSASESELKLIAAQHPEYREAINRAIGIMSSQWARLTMVRQAVK